MYCIILNFYKYNKSWNRCLFVEFSAIPIKQKLIQNKYTLNKCKYKYICNTNHHSVVSETTYISIN